MGKMTPSPVSLTVNGALRIYTKLTGFVADILPLESTEYAAIVFVPGTRFTCAVQFVQKPLLGIRSS